MLSLFILKVFMWHIKLNGMKFRTTLNLFDLMHTPDLAKKVR